MITLTRLSPQVCAGILRAAQRNLRKFEDLGADTRPDVISFENCEYVAKLLAIESRLPFHRRSAHDRDIVLRVCEQFLESGIPELREWAIAEMRKQQEQLQAEIRDCEFWVEELLVRLESSESEVTACN